MGKYLKKEWLDQMVPDAILKTQELSVELLPLQNGKNELDKTAMTSSQLRRFFGEIKKIQANAKKGIDGNITSEILMLQPKLAYAAGRAKKENKIHVFYSEVKPVLSEINTKNFATCKIHFDNFVRIVEAIVAFHKERETLYSKDRQ